MTARSFAQRISSALGVREGRDRYLRENGFDTSMYEKDWFDLDFFGFTVTLPNPEVRKKVVALHDLHHVATGYGTDLVGEGEIGMWELTAGCTTPFLYGINLLALGGGLLLAPRRMLAAHRDARGKRTLYVDGTPYDEILKLSVGELREKLGIPEEGLARFPAHLHDAAPSEPEPA